MTRTPAARPRRDVAAAEASSGVDGKSDATSVRARVTNTLRSAIVAGEMKPGVVYSAPTLAADFNVSATPVREAMIDLARDGYVEVVRNKGFRVTEPSLSKLRDMLELRLLIEVPTVGRVAEVGIGTQQRNALRPLAEETLRAAQRHRLTEHVAADLEFHVAVLALAGNEALVDTVRSLRSRSRLYRLSASENQDSLLVSAREHLELVELLHAQKAAEAETLIRRHITRVGSQFAP